MSKNIHKPATMPSRYNLVDTAAGDHADMIGNWVEERALKEATGVTRHEPMHLQGIVSNTHQRVIAHSQCDTVKETWMHAQHPPVELTTEPKLFNIAKWNDETRQARFSAGEFKGVEQPTYVSMSHSAYVDNPSQITNQSSFFPSMYKSNPIPQQRQVINRTPESYLR